jgi:adenosine/AMP kinase
MFEVIACHTFSIRVHSVTRFAFATFIRAANGTVLRIGAAHTFTVFLSVSFCTVLTIHGISVVFAGTSVAFMLKFGVTIYASPV